MASLFVPDSALAFLQEKLDAYTNNPLGKRDAVPFRDRFEQLGQISVASLESLWTDRRSLPEDRDAKVWWECWTWRDLISELTSHAQQLDFQVSTKTLRFPDLEIIPLHGSTTQIEQLIGSTSAIEQLRYASDSPTFFTTTVQREQHPWVDDLVDRIATASGDSPVVVPLRYRCRPRTPSDYWFLGPIGLPYLQFDLGRRRFTSSRARNEYGGFDFIFRSHPSAE